jgi:hypothetical protein
MVEVTQSIIDGWNAAPFSITNHAPSHRQFRLHEELTPEQITAAIGSEPTLRPSGGNVSMEWKFFAEKRYWHDGKAHSVSTCCKVWDYGSDEEGYARWSAYGFPEAFAQIGLEPMLIKDYGTWAYQEDGNPTIAVLTATSAKDKRIAELEADAIKLEHENERIWRERNIAYAKVKAWEAVLYVEGLPLRAVRVDEWGPGEAEQTTVPEVTPKRLVELLDRLADLEHKALTP